MLGLRLRYLSFHGQNRAPAVIEFGPGLNVIYGASDTGKSFIVEALDFMLGGKGPLRDMTERDGYTRVMLAIETLAGASFTISRSVDGLAFTLFDGLYSDATPSTEGRSLAEKHNDKRDDNLSAFLLSKIGLNHKRIRKNKAGVTNSLSFRNLARLVIVDEEEIIQKRTPLSDGSVTNDTSNASVFKLLLTGTDDHELDSSASLTPEKQSRGAQLDLLDQLIADYKAQVKELAGPPAQLSDQLDKLEETMGGHAEQLAVTEGQYRDLAKRRRELIGKLDEGSNRLTEINALLDRFDLLDNHYSSDIDRLRSIEEAGTLFSALGTSHCPLCGSAPEDHRQAEACDGDVEAIITASRAEIAKIEVRQAELLETISALEKEAQSHNKRIPRIESELQEFSKQIEEITAPNLRQLRRSYGELADKRSEVKEALGLYRTLKDMEDRKARLEAEDLTEGGGSVSNTELPAGTTDRFATLVLELLRDWHFPHTDRAHYDPKTRDLVIDGKPRISYGKGLRAITYAAFVIGLLEFCRRNETIHPGFVVLDSPLLSYREPDGAEDDMSGSDLNSCFYDFLSKMADDRQVIIVENTDPPAFVQSSPHAMKFTGNPLIGRAGFFPPLGSGNTPPPQDSLADLLG